MASLIAERIEEVLTPVIGTVLASVSVDVEAKRLGKTPDDLTREDLPAISENLSQALLLLVGRDLASAAAARVRDMA